MLKATYYSEKKHWNTGKKYIHSP